MNGLSPEFEKGGGLTSTKPETEETQPPETKPERREKKRRKKRNKMLQHGKGLAGVYRDAVQKRVGK
ncbi:MAG: hypothetical protein Q8P00_06570 [Dehalococcoidia bacterium]|nr:hypothetical protein [Dehalococcoidia bacterium]